MDRVVIRSSAIEPPRDAIARGVRTIRHAVGETQAELGGRVGCSQAFISNVETARAEALTIESAASIIDALGGRLEVVIVGPLLAGSRQRDAGHARCLAAVDTRLRRAGWLTDLEASIGDDQVRGWIDVLAYHETSGLVLVVEVKTELHDLGDIQRTLGWYEREAWAAARQRGWRPRAIRSVLVVLHTAAVDDRIGDNPELIRRAFPARASEVQRMVDGGAAIAGRGLALVDPRSRRAAWLRPTRLDGRRTDAPYEDYVGYLRSAGIGLRDGSRSDHAGRRSQRGDRKGPRGVATSADRRSHRCG